MSLPGPKLRREFIPAPIDGLNLIALPGVPEEDGGFKLTEARQLDNYYVYDWGIRERPLATLVALPDAGVPNAMFSFTSAGFQGTLVASALGHLYRYTTGGAFTLLGTTNPLSGPFAFNKVVYFCNATAGTAETYALGSDTYAAASFTFSGGFKPIGGFGYKDRAYFFDGTSGVVQFGGIGAITGAVDGTFDFSQLFHRGQRIVWGAKWSYNQGTENFSLFVIGNEAGEVLIYGGDSPKATNWGLVTAIDLPNPLQRPAGYPSSALPLRQDVLISTSQGCLSLAGVVAGASDDSSLYSVSKNLGPILTGAQADKSLIIPFAYFAGVAGIFVLNYRRGAWSKFPLVVPPGHYTTCLSCSTQPLVAPPTSAIDSYVLIGLSVGGFFRINESDLVADSTNSYVWKTPFLDFGKPLQKDVKFVRALSRDMASSLVTNSVTVARDLVDATAGGASTKSTAVTSTAHVLQELAPSQVGESLSLLFSKTGSATALNELAGAKLVYEEGGMY